MPHTSKSIGLAFSDAQNTQSFQNFCLCTKRDVIVWRKYKNNYWVHLNFVSIWHRVEIEIFPVWLLLFGNDLTDACASKMCFHSPENDNFRPISVNGSGGECGEKEVNGFWCKSFITQSSSLEDSITCCGNFLWVVMDLLSHIMAFTGNPKPCKYNRGTENFCWFWDVLKETAVAWNPMLKCEPHSFQLLYNSLALRF